MVGSDDRLDELAPDNGIQAGGALVQHEQIGLRADRGDQRQLGALSFRESRSAFGGIEPKPIEEFQLHFFVPALPEGRQIIEGLANCHPRINASWSGT